MSTVGRANRVTERPSTERRGPGVLWLIVGAVLLVIAIAGGAIVHPVLFVLGVLALIMFVMHFRGGGRRARTY